MKTFKLKKALKGERVVTRDGREVLELYYFKSAYDTYPVVAVVQEKCGSIALIRHYTVDGYFIAKGSIKHPFDLFMEDIRRPSPERLGDE